MGLVGPFWKGGDSNIIYILKVFCRGLGGSEGGRGYTKA